MHRSHATSGGGRRVHTSSIEWNPEQGKALFCQVDTLLQRFRIGDQPGSDVDITGGKGTTPEVLSPTSYDRFVVNTQNRSDCTALSWARPVVVATTVLRE